MSAIVNGMFSLISRHQLNILSNCLGGFQPHLCKVFLVQPEALQSGTTLVKKLVTEASNAYLWQQVLATFASLNATDWQKYSLMDNTDNGVLLHWCVFIPVVVIVKLM